MTIYWGAWETAPSPGGTSGMRVGLEPSWSTPSNTSTTVTLTVKVYTENYLAYTGDSQVINFGGTAGSGWSDYSFSNSSGTKTIVLRTTKSYTYTYGSTSYGTSPGTKTVSATMSGVFDGTTASETITVTIPARPVGIPAAPSSVVGTRNSDAQATVTWVRNSTTAKPYTSQTVQMRTYTGSTWGAWVTIATASSTATSYVKTGLSANHAYQFQVRANNGAGSSAYTASGNVYTTPAAPSSVSSAVNAAGTQITTTWVNNHYAYSGITLTIERSVNGAAYASVVTGLAYTTTSWTDPTPGGGTNQYRVKAVNSVGALSSAYGTGNSVTTVVPPLAPTLLSPNGLAVDLANTAVTLTWKHNPGTDNAPQSHFTIQYSSDGGATWTALVTNVASTASSYVLPAGTLSNATRQWRVSTQGSTLAAFGPYSAAATLVGSSTPTATLLTPPATVFALPLTTSWDYDQAELSPQAAWEAKLLASDGITELESQDGTTESSASFAYPVVDSGSYVVKVRVQSGAGLWSDWATASTFINLPSPAAINTVADFQPETGSVLLTMAGANPLPAPANRTNLQLDPSWRTPSVLAEVRRNYAPDARGITLAFPTNSGASWASSKDSTFGRSVLNSVKSTPTAAAIGTTRSLASWFNVGGLVTGITAGDIWTVSAYVAHNADGDCEANIYVVFMDAGGATLATQNAGVYVPIDNGQRWARISYTTTAAPANTTQMRVLTIVNRTVASGNIKAGEFAWVTDVLAEKAGTALGFFVASDDPQDGLTYTWAGTVNNSASIASGLTFTTNAPFTAYTTTAGMVGWQLEPGIYRMLAKYAVADSGIFGFSGTGPVIAAGQFRAGRIKARVIDSDVDLEVRPRLAAYSSTGIVNVLAERSVDTALPADDSWYDIPLPSTAAAGTGAATVRWLFYSGQLSPAGTTIDVKEALQESVTAAGVQPGAYFDGDTPDISTMDFAWTGTPNASTSTGTGQAEIAVSFANVDRRINGGEWVTLTTGLTLPADFVDPLPVTNGLNEYRVTSVSTAPSYRANDLVTVIPANGSMPGSDPALQWVFLNYGDAFDILLRFRSAPEIKVTTEREKGTQKFLGRSKPVLLLGDSRTRQVSVGGNLAFDPSGSQPDLRLWDSPPDDWEDAALAAEVVCFRDFTGRRIFGALSSVDTASLIPGLASVSFAVTETDHTEQYGAQGE